MSRFSVSINTALLKTIFTCTAFFVITGCGGGNEASSQINADTNSVANNESDVSQNDENELLLANSANSKRIATVSSTSKIIYGVNGHDGWSLNYPLSQAEARFQILASRNIRSYRLDISATQTNVLDTLVPLAKKYGITIRPMLYPTTQQAAYNIAKRYANDIKVWEIGNEINLRGKSDAAKIMPSLVATYLGIKQASNALNAGLKTSINFTSCNDDYVGSGCYGDPNGHMWFLDMARQAGFQFDLITFHTYPFYGDKGYWNDKYLSQMRAAATKYKTKVFLNETNCAEIYRGNTDGGYPGDRACYDGINQFIEQVRTQHADIVAEINMYEMLDQPSDLNVNPISERHFGLMYDLNRPKPLFNLLSKFSMQQ